MIMKRLLAIVFSMMVSLGVASSQTLEGLSPAEQHIAQALKMEAEGEIAEAIILYKSAAELAAKGGKEEEPNYISATLALTRLHHNMGNYDAAIAYGEGVLSGLEGLKERYEEDYALMGYYVGASYFHLERMHWAAHYLEAARPLLDKYRIAYTLEWMMCYTDLGEAYFTMGDYEKALQYHLSNFDFKARRSDLLKALGACDIAHCYDALGDMAKAKEYALTACEIWSVEERDDTTEITYAECCVIAGRGYAAEGKLDQALEYYNQAHSIYATRAEEFSEEYGLTLFDIGMTHRFKGDTELCILHLSEAERALEPYRSQRGDIFALLYCTLGQAHYDKDERGEAIRYMKLAQPLLAQSSKDNAYLYAINQLFLADEASGEGDYVEAKRNLDFVASLRESLRDTDPALYALIISQHAQYRASLGEEEEARTLLEEAVAIYEKEIASTPDAEIYIEDLSQVANCYTWLGEHQKALGYHLRALNTYIDREGTDTEKKAYLLCNVANAYNDMALTAEFIDYAEQARSLVRELQSKEVAGYAYTLYSLSLQYTLEEGSQQQAPEVLLEAMEQIRSDYGTDHHLYISAMNMLCAHLYDKGDYEALSKMWFALYKQIKDTTKHRFQAMTERQREYFWNTNVSHILTSSYSNYTAVLADDAAAMTTSYDAMLLSKGLLLNYNIEFDRIIRESGDKELIALLDEMKLYRAELNQIYALPDAKRDHERMKRLEEGVEACEQILIEHSQEYARYTSRNSIDLHWYDIQEALGEGEVAVEFMAATETVDEPYYAALVLRKEWREPRFVYLCKASEIEELHSHGQEIYSGELSAKLYDKIWGALEPHIKDGESIYFAPAGVLHQINIEVLQDSKGERANTRYKPARLSSTREIWIRQHRQQPPEEERNIVAVLYGDLKYDMDTESILRVSRQIRGGGQMVAHRGFDPSPQRRDQIAELPATALEIQSITATLAERDIPSRVLSRAQGNEESFKALSGHSPTILHIATHGFFFRNEEAADLPFYRAMAHSELHKTDPSPLRRSGLILSGGERAWLGEELPAEVEDGILLAEEIATMDLRNVELVVLSACDTGLGEITSEGVFGLQRALKMAGVESIMMSLWKVEDQATALFMQRFYSEWMGGRSKREAFAEAQRSVREEYSSAPEMWAAFILLD